jgi:tRNA 2-thiocytidine biosynthesis protein TtcA
LNRLEQLEKKLLHHTGKAIGDYQLISEGDKILVCLSGGKDSFTMLTLLKKLQARAKINFELLAFTLDQSQPGWDDSKLRAWLNERNISFEILTEDTYSIVVDKIPEGKTYCSLCSRLRRGIIYSYAEKNKFNKIALGHHRDDLITSLLMSIFYNGEIKSMPPKLLSDDKKNIVIRPLAYCQEKEIAEFAELMEFPIIPCNLCGSQENLVRKKTKKLIETLAKENSKIPSNILHALQSIKPSQLMDKSLWNFESLENNEAEKSPEATTEEHPILFHEAE